MEVWNIKRPLCLFSFQFCFKDRPFKVRVGSTFTDCHPQEMGVPQGSILSVALFLVKINSSTQCQKPGVDCLLIFRFATDHPT